MSKIVSLTPNRDRVAAALARSGSQQPAPVDRRTAVNINAAAGSNVHLHFHQHGDTPLRTPEELQEAPEVERARFDFEGLMAGHDGDEEEAHHFADKIEIMLGMKTRTAPRLYPLADFRARGAAGAAGKPHPAARTARFK